MEDIGNVKETQTQKQLREALEKAQAEYKASFFFMIYKELKEIVTIIQCLMMLIKQKTIKRYIYGRIRVVAVVKTQLYMLYHILQQTISIYAKANDCAIGEGGSSFYGIRPYESRFKKYEEYGFSKAVITKIEQFLAINSPVPYDDDEDEDDV